MHLVTSSLGLVGIALMPSVAQAQYLDPGAGSLVVQVVIAGMVGASAFLKIYWNKISSFFERRSKIKQ
jgi:hypothetical protein